MRKALKQFWLSPYFVSVVNAIMIITALSLHACKTVEHKRAKQTAKLDKIKAKCDANDDLKSVPPLWAVKNWPVKPFTKTITKYLPGKRDTLTKHDTVTAKCPDGTVIKTPCPPTRTITVRDTLVIHDTTLVENTAVSEALHYTNDSLSKLLAKSYARCDKAEEKAERRGKTSWGFGLLSLLLTGIIGLLIWGKIR